MTPEELQAIRERHREVSEAVPEIDLSQQRKNHHGLLAHADRYSLLAEIDRLTAENERLRELIAEDCELHGDECGCDVCELIRDCRRTVSRAVTGRGKP